MNPENGSNNTLRKADIISSIVIFIFGLYVLAHGIYMSFYAVTGTKVWYYSPGMYPIVLGSALMVLSVLLFLKNYAFSRHSDDNSMNGPESFEGFWGGVHRSTAVLRLLISIIIFAVYIFVLFGNLPFILATFIYLSVTITVFRQNKFAIWKIIIVALFTSVTVYFLFGIIAAVPLK